MGKSQVIPSFLATFHSTFTSHSTFSEHDATFLLNSLSLTASQVANSLFTGNLAACLDGHCHLTRDNRLPLAGVHVTLLPSLYIHAC